MALTPALIVVVVAALAGLGVVIALLYESAKVRQAKRDQLLTILIEGQQRANQAVLNAVNSMADASSKQAEVLGQYLKLFQTPGEPERWVADPEADNLEELRKLGFPEKGTDAEQAKWVLDNLDKM